MGGCSDGGSSSGGGGGGGVVAYRWRTRDISPSRRSKQANRHSGTQRARKGREEERKTRGMPCSRQAASLSRVL